MALKLRWGPIKVEDALSDLAPVVSLIFDLSLAIEKAIFRTEQAAAARVKEGRMHPVDALPPITVRCTDYNELVFAFGFASDKKTARFLEQMVWLLRCEHICKE